MYTDDNEILVNKAAEKSVIGLLILEPEKQNILDTISETIFTGVEQTIIKAFKNARKKIDNISIVELMEEVKKLNSNIEVSTLSNITSWACKDFELKKNINVLKELDRKRNMHNCLDNSIKALLNGEEVDTLSFDLINNLEGLKSEINVNKYEGITDLLTQSMNRLENTKEGSTKFGYSLLDDNIGGVDKGGYTVIGAKSGVGKTTLALNIAFNVMKQNKKVLYISREMKGTDLIDRFITKIGGIPTVKFRNKNFNENDWKKYIEAAEMLSTYGGNFIVDTKSTKMSEIIRGIQDLKPDLVVIDYLQLIESESNARNESTEQKISNISRSIRNATLKYNCHIIALVQLNNSFKGIPSGENVIRYSSVVYQDATTVIYLHEPTEIEELKYIYSTTGGIDDKGRKDILETNKEKKEHSVYGFNLDKNRNGATGIEPITFIRPSFTMLDKKGLREIGLKN